MNSKIKGCGAVDRWYKKGNELLREIDNAKTPDGISLWFLGQMGFVIKINETVIYIDALLNDFSEGDTYRVYEPPFLPAQGIKADYFICTHNHGDHLNLDTLLPQAKTNPKTKFIVPSPCRTILTQAGIEDSRVLGAKEGETIILSPPLNGVSDSEFGDEKIELFPIAAAHPVYEDGPASGEYACLGFVIRGNGVCVYHAGDTMVTPRLLETLQKYKPIDIALLPVNGADWERTASGIIGNMSVEDAVKLVRKLEIDLAVPAHYDMMSNNSVNPARFADEMYRVCPQKKYHIFALGEQFYYKKRSRFKNSV